MEMEFMIVCDENGKLIGMKVKIIVDLGVYLLFGGLVF